MMWLMASITLSPGIPQAPSTDDRPTSAPPYVSWTTVLNAIERMEGEGDVPSRLDRSYIKNMPGSTQAQFRHACRWLGLVDADDIPTDLLRMLVHKAEDRPSVVEGMLRSHYPGPLSLPRNATQQQLEEQFRELGSNSAETLRKSVAFFLHACKYAGIELSPQFMQPRAGRSTNGTGRRGRRKNAANAAEAQAQPQPAQPPNDAPNIIRDLLTKLPPEGATWQREKVEQWLGIARLTFEMVYDLKGKYSDAPLPGSTATSPTQAPPTDAAAP
jgi:hypothetical protein